jgi:hypothetical protein
MKSDSLIFVDFASHDVEACGCDVARKVGTDPAPPEGFPSE